MIAGKNKVNIDGFSSIYSGSQVDRAVGNALIIEPIDLNEAAALITNTYYRHVGETSEDFIKNLIYFYDGKELTSVTGGGGSCGVFIGTQNEYNIAYAAGKVSVGMIVVITDDYNNNETTAILGRAILGRIILGTT